VHQVEIEMQNEEHRRSQIDLEESRDRYVDFYDFAPTGYITLNHEGMIHEINLTGATLLGIDRKKLIKRLFASFVATEDRDRWHFFFQSVLNNPNKKSLVNWRLC
jgi:PAS domain S-box-containing protein